MTNFIQAFDELTGEDRVAAGGKGGVLAILRQAGYPVPDGLVILPLAFGGDELKPEAWIQVQEHLSRMRAYASKVREEDGQITFAVRSSALSEDSAQASFAGEFETVLDVRSDDEILAAIHTVRRSRNSERVRSYTQAKGLETYQDEVHEIAVVVQRLVRSEISGVLFTADPVTGSYARMSGNFVHGLGDQLVSGGINPETFIFERPKGRYKGPPELKRHARKLYKLANRLERELGGPQDIEWTIARDKFYLLQSRPITTMKGYNLATGEWNDSLRGDFLWTNVNVGEGRPDVMTPLTWTLGEDIRRENQPIPGDYPFVGNIGGRTYMNVSITLSMFRALGMNPRRLLKRMVDMLGPVPEGMDVPLFPFPLSTFFAIFPGMRKTIKKEREVVKKIPEFLVANPDWCREMQQRILEIRSADELASIWHLELKPYFIGAGFMVTGGFKPYAAATRKLRPELIKLVGEADANALLSNLSDESELLASLGLVVGVAKVASGEMSRQEYLDRYGHRGPHEMELSIPRPAEDPDWLDRQLDEYRKAPMNVDALLEKRSVEFYAAWERFQDRYPRKAKSVQRRINKVAPAARLREAIRSEVTRVYAVVRSWALRAGELTGLEDDVFFLTYEELFKALAGDKSASAYIPARRHSYNRYKALPPYPSIIRGRFDPFQWAADPNRRGDVYDAYATIPLASDSTVITGVAGAAGNVKGVVRRLDSPEEGDQLQPGEILVAVTTNVGWTPLFPRAAAVITDVGAPFSHAAIVARELGIPAVVGCVNATTRLKTGDRVRVVGEQGAVEILEAQEAQG